MEPSSLSEYYEGGPKTWDEAFPPVCIKTSRNPTAVSQYILPQKVKQHDAGLDPRPSTRICTSYYSLSPGSSGFELPEDKPLSIPEALIGHFGQFKDTADMPYFGGRAGLGASYATYMANIDKESDVYQLNRALTKCKEGKYMPKELVPASNRIVDAHFGTSSMLSPQALEVSTQAGCREADDNAAWNRSSRLFFNPTRNDRVGETRHVEGRNVLSCEFLSSA